MSVARYDIITPRPGKDGRTFWLKISMMVPSNDGAGFSIKLDAMPLPNKDGEVWIKASEPRQRGDKDAF
jgi:hypothetical protein